MTAEGVQRRLAAWRSWSPFRWWVTVATLVYLAFSLVGVTTTNTTRLSEDGAPNQQQIVVGKARDVRSDEFLRSTPEFLSSEFGVVTTSPFDVASHGAAIVNIGDLSFAVPNLISIEHYPRTLLPKSVEFAAGWWWYIYVAALALPGLLVLLGVRFWIALSATLTTFALPAVGWWSYWPLSPAAAAAASLAVVILALRLASDRQARLAKLVATALLAFGGGLIAARLPLMYQPWSVPIALSLIAASLPTIAVLVWRNPLRSVALLAISATTLVTVAAFGLLRLREVFEVATATVYPGQRRSASGSPDALKTWLTDGFQWFQQLETPSSANASELSTAMPFVLIVAAAGLLLTWRRWRSIPWLSALFMLGMLGFFISWVFLDWPESAIPYNPLAFLPPNRLIIAIGILAPLALALVCEAAARSPKMRSARIRCAPSRLVAGAVVAAAIAILSWQAASAWTASYYPSMPRSFILASIVALSLVSFLTILYLGRSFALAPILLLAVASSALINPIAIGPGALRESRGAEAIRALASQDPDAYWAGGNADIFLQALLRANGVRSLDGQQTFGPNEDLWRKFDPTGAAIEAWNRGASYVVLDIQPGTKKAVGTLTGDVVVVMIDPCDPTLAETGVRWTISARAIDSPCATPVSEFTWMGVPRTIYELGNPPVPNA